MNRFLCIRITSMPKLLDTVANRARALQVKPGGLSGFELELITRKRMVLRWFEKIVTERKIESGPFENSSYFEIKIVTFGLALFSSSNKLILIDPPLGKHRVLSVLRSLFPEGNFVFLPIDVSKSVESLLKEGAIKVVAVETEPTTVKPNISLSMTVSGYGDVVKYLTEKHPRNNSSFKAAQLESEVPSGDKVKITILASGLVRFSDEISYEDIENIAERIVFKSDEQPESH